MTSIIATGVGCLGREAENAPWGMSSGLALEETSLVMGQGTWTGSSKGRLWDYFWTDS